MQSPPISTALLSIGFVEAKLADFAGTAGYRKRLTDPQGYLGISADFRGDGHLDQARILRNVKQNVAYVVVVSVREKVDTYVIRSMPLAEVDSLGLKVAEPVEQNRASGLTIFTLDGNRAETFDFDGDGFNRRVVP